MSGSRSSSLDRPRMNYDVFISFRGRDVRYTFVGYLYDALNRLGITAFMDEKRLQYGDNLHDLFQIIDESRSAIVVLSEDYASAKWCLRELAKIMDSMGTTMERVLPVFYHVDPSTVKDQSETFKKSFDEHEVDAQKEIDNQEKEKRLKDLQNWKKAMKKIGNHTGVVITKNSSEVEVVKKIAQQIFDAWRPKLETFNKNLVGMTSRLLQMNMHLGLGLDDVRLIAIVGTGGIGKTTIAQVVFDCILSKFDDCCFLPLSRGDSKQSIVSLQHEMLSQIFPTESFRIWHENHGLEMIKKRLSGRKVLIVLDCVEEKRQLEMLVGSIEWFGHGSRVIVTARNKGLLYHNNNVETKEYIVEDLDHNSALQLFLRHAFGIKHQNHGDFMDLINKIVEKVKRLPLALRVIGSFLYGKEISIWRETSKRIIKVDEKSLFDVLKISYDGLGVESQQVFLDLTCFFNGRSEDRVIEILESFGYSPKSEIQLLMQRCLIEVSRKKILVHDLILEMGREIVRRESLTQPGKQSRVWLHEDLYCMFVENHELVYIQGIVLHSNLEMKDSIQLDAKFFSKLTKLRILEINNVELSDDIVYLSQLLRLILWPGYPLKCLPTTFQSRYLFELLLPHSCIVQLWEGKKKFEKLKVIDLHGSKQLRMTPDFSKVPNLERLVLCNCVSLCEIHPSINCLDNLTFLDLENCANLELFPPNMICKNLQKLVLAGTGLETSPEIGGIMERLTHLNLARSKIIQLHPSIQHLTSLISLNLSACIRLSSLPSDIGNLRSLKTLNLEGCRELDQIPQSLGNAESLETLSIQKTSISHIPSSMHSLKYLQWLDCEGLSRGIWKSMLPQFNNIDSPIIVSSSSLAGCLKALDLSYCKLVDEDLPNDLHYFSSLETLDLSYNSFTTLPNSFSHLKKLKRLLLNYCTELKDLPELPASLESVKGLECNSISKKFYNKRMHIPSSSNHGLYLDFPIHSKTTKVECTMNAFQYSMLTQRSYERAISDEEPFAHIFNEVDIVAECFDQIKDGCRINIEYNQESSFHSDISTDACGVFLSAIMALDHVGFGKISVTFQIDGHLLNFGGLTISCSKLPTTKKCILVIYIPFRMFKNESMVQSPCSINAKISCDGEDGKVTVKACGVSSILSWQNVSEYLAMFFTKVFSPKHKFHMILAEKPIHHKRESGCDDEFEVANDYFISSTFESDHYSTFLPEKNLLSILGRIFEEQKHYQSKYFFPYTKISRWFGNQYKKNKMVMKLPLNIRKEKKWMGLAMFAVFSISENARCLCFDNLIQLASSKSTWRNKKSIPMKFLEYSNQILFIQFLSHNFRRFDELNSSSANHVYISFNTNVERMQVELCGARLVDYQNVEGLAHSIVDCIVESGDDLYAYYNQQILKDHLRMISSQKHQNSSLQVASVNQQPTAALSYTHDSSLSVEHLLHASFLHPLLHKSIQERFGSKFDFILNGEKIPKIFTNQSVGNMAETKLTECWGIIKNVGIFMCARLVVDKQRGKLNDITERDSYTKVVDLLCSFRVDSYEISQANCHFVSVRKLLSQYASKFIWLSYIPLTKFDISWHDCNQLEVTFETSYDELFQVERCGVRLIHKKERKEIDKMIMESTVFDHQNT